MCAFLSENTSNGFDAICVANERSEDHVDILLHSKMDVFNISLGNRRQIHISTRQIHSFFVSKRTSILYGTDETIAVC